MTATPVRDGRSIDVEGQRIAVDSEGYLIDRL